MFRRPLRISVHRESNERYELHRSSIFLDASHVLLHILALLPGQLPRLPRALLLLQIRDDPRWPPRPYRFLLNLALLVGLLSSCGTYIRVYHAGEDGC